mmetsp:Transcript_25722/g.36294  ORF Transcript_25722/g.36294 Transcript_25722/m.36294 type:complete len:315 (-) Transcript_25722:167-1111(-)
MVMYSQSLLFGALALFGTASAFVPAGTKKALTFSEPGTAFVKHGIPRSSASSPASSSVLFMGWGPEPVWSGASVLSNEAACPSETCVSLQVEVSPDTAAEYKFPGQYVQVRLNDNTKPLFLAIASAPLASEDAPSVFEFLVKKTDENEWMTNAASGSTIQVSQVLGGGFPVEENIEGFKYDFPTQNILLFAVGSGIAPIKAAMEDESFLKVGKAGGGGRSARLYYGVRHPEDLCFVSEFQKWEENGFQVVPVLSDPPEAWQGRSGYVQNALEEDGVPIPRNSGALLCGMKGMAESVKDILTKAGVFEGRVLTNF